MPMILGGLICVTCLNEAGTVSAEATDDFYYQFTSESPTHLNLSIEFGDYGEGVDNSSLKFQCTKGGVQIDYAFYSQEGDLWSLRIDRLFYNLMVNYSYVHYMEDPMATYTDNKTMFWTHTPIDDAKAQLVKYSQPCGIDNLSLSKPTLQVKGEENVLVWTIVYTTIAAIYDSNGEAQWDTNSSFNVNTTYMFHVEGQEAHFKTDTILSDFDIHPNMNGSCYENGTLETALLVEVNNPDENHDATNTIWRIDGQVVPETWGGDHLPVEDKSTLMADDLLLTQIYSPDTFAVDGIEKNVTNSATVTPVPPLGIKELNLFEEYAELNFSSLESIRVDPDVVVYFQEGGGNGGWLGDIPGFPFLLIAGFSLVAIVKITVSKRSAFRNHQD